MSDRKLPLLIVANIKTKQIKVKLDIYDTEYSKKKLKVKKSHQHNTDRRLVALKSQI
jgi:hypothetical protein